MTNLEMRVYRLEQLMLGIQQQLAALQIALGTLAQNQYAGASQGFGGGSSTQALLCYPSGTIAAASGPPASGTPGGPLSGQDIYQITGGAFTPFATGADVYNGMGSAVDASKVLIVEANSDGTFTGVAQSCV